MVNGLMQIMEKAMKLPTRPTDKVLGTVPNCGTSEAKRAIEAANTAWPKWRSKTSKERANLTPLV